MSQNTNQIICEVPQEITDKLKEFRFRKSKKNAALILKVDKDDFKVKIEQLLDGCTMEDLAEELPDNQPRFVVYSFEYVHQDGRVSYPLIFFYWSPTTVKPEMHMLYASAKTHVVQKCEVGKVYDIRELSTFTETWLKEKLSFFK
ncbi:hypothetical protein MP228_010760 [Amoeboaphelidium protococcarum]|nr:hypothetical protein MP228_010760 [Amoeboaphelidium protococcarum]